MKATLLIGCLDIKNIKNQFEYCEVLETKPNGFHPGSVFFSYLSKKLLNVKDFRNFHGSFSAVIYIYDYYRPLPGLISQKNFNG